MMIRKVFPVLGCTVCALLAGPVFAAEDFLTHPELLQADNQIGADRVYLPESALPRLPAYSSIMVDEPEIFIAPDSPYTGFKPSDIQALSNLMRESFSKGLSSEAVSIGNYQVVEQAGADTLYLRIALKNVYIRKNKRGLLSYTPVGAAVKGLSDATSETIEKTTLVEMSIEAELQDSTSQEVLFAAVLDRGQRKDKQAKQEEQAATWEVTGAIAEVMGRRLACRLDNARLQESERRDCVASIPVP